LRGYYPPKFALYDSENPYENYEDLCPKWGFRNEPFGKSGWEFDPTIDKMEKRQSFTPCAFKRQLPSQSFYTTDICFSGQCRKFRCSWIPSSTPEEIRTIGPDATILTWQIEQQKYNYPLFDVIFRSQKIKCMELKWLDIHTLPQSLMRTLNWREQINRAAGRLIISDCKVRRIQFDKIRGLSMLVVRNCPLFEGFDDFPQDCGIQISVENCPLFFHMPVAYNPSGTINETFTGLVFTSVRTFTLPNLGKIMDFWSRAREELAAEAFKPARLNRRIEEFGLEAALEY